MQPWGHSGPFHAVAAPMQEQGRCYTEPHFSPGAARLPHGWSRGPVAQAVGAVGPGLLAGCGLPFSAPPLRLGGA